MTKRAFEMRREQHWIKPDEGNNGFTPQRMAAAKMFLNFLAHPPGEEQPRTIEVTVQNNNGSRTSHVNPPELRQDIEQLVAKNRGFPGTVAYNSYLYRKTVFRCQGEITIAYQLIPYRQEKKEERYRKHDPL